MNWGNSPNSGDGNGENREVAIGSVFALFAEGKKEVTESCDASRFVVRLFDDMTGSKHTLVCPTRKRYKKKGGKKWAPI
jgi:hypothetical protein